MSLGRAPDYDDPADWAVRPGADAIARCLPGGGMAPSMDHPTDVFYVHPTTFVAEAWNQDLDDPATNAWTDRSAISRQLSVCAGSCRMFAPRYRQASSRAFRDPSGGSASYALAYGDVRKAFSHYLRHNRKGRRFILFGHSQGALHIGRLLAEVIEPECLVPDMIAAYAIGIGLSTGLFGTRFKQILPCDRADQRGCLISWNAFLPGADPSGLLHRTAARDAAALCGRAAGPPVCVNPLGFGASEQRQAANPGSLLGAPGMMPPLQPGLVGATCRDGILWLDTAPDPATGLTPLPGGNMHMHDVALFYAALRNDIARRAGAA